MSYDVIKSIVVLIALLIAFGVFGWRAYQLLWINLRRGQKSPEAFGRWVERIKGVLAYVAAQGRLFRVLIPGTAHFFIFWGFLFLSLTILQAIVEGLFAFIDPHFKLPIIGEFGPLALAQDFFALFVVIAIVYALYLRLVVNPERYKGSHKSQGVLVLSFIMTIMLTLLVFNGILINLGKDSIAAWRPISTLFGLPFVGLDKGAQFVVGEIAYWLHLGVVLFFLTELPEGKHFHIVTSVPAVFLRDLDPPGRLPKAPEFDGKLGVSAIDQFRWRQMLDFYTCTECGRCQDVCPAYSSAQILSPKLLIMNLRDALRLTTRGAKPLIPDTISEQVAWACTTCYACDQECPLFIQHVKPLVDLRRYLVSEGKMDAQLQEALAKLGRYGNSFGQSERNRAKWAATVQPKIKDARKEPVEYLWFVGDYAAYSPSVVDITRQTADVFQRAGLDFGILYEGERNSGNDVRRVGEEGLFEMLVEKNIAAMSKANFKTIVTTDPHTYNTLKHEYPQMANGELRIANSVLHYAEVIDQLIASGKLKFSKKLDYTVTYHDPCYLGRYNGVYDAPRRVIEATGCKLVEMPRHGDRALCCGAGGGRIWMEEGAVKERPSESRIREAVALDGVSIFVAACPKDITMFRDAVKTTGSESRLVVKDLIELVNEAMS
ncbi:MAG: 4Fe-4S dicluster domain-containing protein [Chloroflexi bacterium]|nr:4Fe-4S dicluster domain-containing protein [Chloroflexota bacterium]